MTVELVLEALDNAITEQHSARGMIMYTDLWTKYTSKAFQKQLQLYDITSPYSRKGCPYNNACIESFHMTLKKEKTTVHVMPILKWYVIALFLYIEGWYNRKRIHGSIGYFTPDAFEKLCRAAA